MPVIGGRRRRSHRKSTRRHSRRRSSSRRHSRRASRRSRRSRRSHRKQRGGWFGGWINNTSTTDAEGNPPNTMKLTDKDLLDYFATAVKNGDRSPWAISLDIQRKKRGLNRLVSAGVLYEIPEDFDLSSVDVRGYTDGSNKALKWLFTELPVEYGTSSGKYPYGRGNTRPQQQGLLASLMNYRETPLAMTSAMTAYKSKMCPDYETDATCTADTNCDWDSTRLGKKCRTKLSAEDVKKYTAGDAPSAPTPPPLPKTGGRRRRSHRRGSRRSRRGSRRSRRGSRRSRRGSRRGSRRSRRGSRRGSRRSRRGSRRSHRRM
jgi:hypothetical protein